MTYHSNAFRDRKRISPDDPVSALGVQADPTQPTSVIGIAYSVGQFGGMDWRQPLADYTPPEVVWRLELDRIWEDGRAIVQENRTTLDGRFVLRLGQFIELAEDAD